MGASDAKNIKSKPTMISLNTNFFHLLVVFAVVSVQLKSSAATFRSDLLTAVKDMKAEVMAGQQKLKEELIAEEKGLKAGQEEIKMDLESGKDEVREKVEELSEAMKFLVSANFTGLKDIKGQLTDVRDRLDEVLYELQDGNETGSHGSGGGIKPPSWTG